MNIPADQRPRKDAVLPYYFMAACCFFLVSLLCVYSASAFTGHYFQPKLLAITHLAILGWACSVIFGASNQLVPVICENKLYNDKRPIFTAFLLLTGIILLVSSFWFFKLNTIAFTGASLIIIAFILHAYNIFKTAQGGKESIVSDFIVTAHWWLIATAALGLLFLLNLRYAFLSGEHLYYLRFHAGIGLSGWFLMLIMGVSAKLVPMFVLSRVEKKKQLSVAYYFLNAGILIYIINLTFIRLNWLNTLTLLCVMTGIIFYFYYILHCLKSALRKKMDIPMRFSILAIGMLAVPFLFLLILYLSDNPVSVKLFNAVLFSFWGGFLSLLIMGQTFKTLPFIVWMHMNKPGELPELLPKDLYREKWLREMMLFYLTGFVLFLSGILMSSLPLLYIGSVLMSIAALAYLIYVSSIIKKIYT